MTTDRVPTVALWAALVVLGAGCGGAGGPVHPPAPTSVPAPSPSLTVTASPLAPAQASPAPSAVASATDSLLPHVVVVVMENREASQVLDPRAAPAISTLAQRYGLATKAYATTHPSLPNYLELIAGTTFGITDDCTGCSVEGTTVVDQLQARGIDWRAYMEGMPVPCYSGTSSPGGYAKKHDPFLYVRHLRSDPNACGRVVPGSEFLADLAAGRLPPFVWLTPDLCHDGHDCSTATADAYLGQLVGHLVVSPWYRQRGIVVVTWDEGTTDAGCCGSAHGGHIATLVISSQTSPGARLDSPVDGAGILRTVESLYGLDYLGDAACPCSGTLLPLLDR